MTSIKTKADINFEQELWKAANELRGAVAENQYKDYILPLIFLKRGINLMDFWLYSVVWWVK